MFSFVKKISVRIFVGKNQSSVKIIVRKKMVGRKIVHCQKKLSFFADFFSSDKVPQFLV